MPGYQTKKLKVVMAALQMHVNISCTIPIFN